MSRTRKLEFVDLRGPYAALLLAMAPAKISAIQIMERFGSSMESRLRSLERAGLVAQCHTEDGAGYCLTPLGRERCPTRRHLSNTAEAFVDARLTSIVSGKRCNVTAN